MSLVIWVIVSCRFFLASAIRVVREYERGVIFRLGRLVGAKGPEPFLCRTIYRCGKIPKEPTSEALWMFPNSLLLPGITFLLL